VNDVLEFPYIFRGALDVRATKINDGITATAEQAIASMAKEPNEEDLIFCKNILFQNHSTLNYLPEYLLPYVAIIKDIRAKNQEPRQVLYIN
jgi:malate dehydrogenase (oxaloacetate-decarboxylating)(NADP+)